MSHSSDESSSSSDDEKRSRRRSKKDQSRSSRKKNKKSSSESDSSSDSDNVKSKDRKKEKSRAKSPTRSKSPRSYRSKYRRNFDSDDERSSKPESSKSKDRRNSDTDDERPSKSESSSKHRLDSKDRRSNRSDSEETSRYSSHKRNRSRSKESRRSRSKDRYRSYRNRGDSRKNSSRNKSYQSRNSRGTDRHRGSSRRSRSKSSSRHRSKRSHSPRRSRSHSPNRRSRRDRSRSKERRSRRSRSRSRSSSREMMYRHRSSRTPPRIRRKREFLKSLQAASVKLNESAVNQEKPSDLPLSSANSSVVGMTPQLAVQQAMAAMSAKAEALTGISLPKYYNPAAVNPIKYAEQMQKRKLLWKNKSSEPEVANKPAGNWEQLSFSQDQDGKVAAKFKKLMGIKEEDQPSEKVETTNELLEKQEVLFKTLDQQYEVARMSTHTHRGVGLGFSSHIASQPSLPR